jgi:hypothetical protein
MSGIRSLGRLCRQLRGRTVAVTTLVTLAGITALSPVPSAGAAVSSYPSTVTSGPVYWCTSIQPLCGWPGAPLTTITRPTPATMVCFEKDQGKLWFYVLMNSGQEGYVWTGDVTGQTKVNDCSTINWLNASNWAIARAGNGALNGTGERYSTAGDGPDQPVGTAWSGACLAFVGDAWAPWGGIGAPTGPSSLPNYVFDYYYNNPQRPDLKQYVHIGGRPPRGAMVFWGTNPWHVAISVGNWQVVGTQGNVPQVLPIAEYNVNSVSNYTGWIMPPQASQPYNN